MTHLRLFPVLICIIFHLCGYLTPVRGLDGFIGWKIEGLGNRGAQVSLGDFHGSHTGKSYWVYRKFANQWVLIDLFRIRDAYTYRSYGANPHNLSSLRVGDILRVPVYAAEPDADSMFYMTIAEDFFSQGLFERSFEQLLLALEKDRGNCQPLALASLRQLGLGLSRDALEIARRSLVLAGKRTRPIDRWSIMALNVAGAAEFETGNPSGAVRAFTRAVSDGAEGDPRGASLARLMKGLVLLSEGYENYGRSEIAMASNEENILDLSLFAPSGSLMARQAELRHVPGFQPMIRPGHSAGPDKALRAGGN
jgi:hypothetical protein